MITRIVKLTFKADKTNDFMNIFNSSKLKIRGFTGCMKLQLLQDIKNNAVFFTYSEWDSQEALDAYRNSELFKTTWEQTKKLFAAAPEAISTKIIFES